MGRRRNERLIMRMTMEGGKIFESPRCRFFLPFLLRPRWIHQSAECWNFTLACVGAMYILHPLYLLFNTNKKNEISRTITFIL